MGAQSKGLNQLLTKISQVWTFEATFFTGILRYKENKLFLINSLWNLKHEKIEDERNRLRDQLAEAKKESSNVNIISVKFLICSDLTNLL